MTDPTQDDTAAAEPTMQTYAERIEEAVAGNPVAQPLAEVLADILTEVGDQLEKLLARTSGSARADAGDGQQYS